MQNSVIIGLLVIVILNQAYLVWRFNKPRQSATTTKPGVYPIKNTQTQPLDQKQIIGQMQETFGAMSPRVVHLTDKHDERALPSEE